MKVNLKPFCHFPSSAPFSSDSASTSQRKRRWILINEALQKSKKFCKNENSFAFGILRWTEELQEAFGVLKRYNIVSVDIPEDTLTLLESYLKACAIFLRGPKGFGDKAKMIHFIAPFFISICSLFKGQAELTIDKKMNGKEINTNGRFAFILKCGSKRISIVEAKKNKMLKGETQALVGCEIASEMDDLAVVYAVLTDFAKWSFLKSCHDCVMIDTDNTLRFKQGVPERDLLKEITGKIYAIYGINCKEEDMKMKI